MLEKTLESPLDCKEIQPVTPKGNQFWVFIGRIDAEAETPILWPLVAKNWLLGKDPDARKDWRQEEKGTTEDEMVGWHHLSMDMSLSKLWELVMDRKAWRAAIHGVAKSRTRLSDWTDWWFVIITAAIVRLHFPFKNACSQRVVWVCVVVPFAGSPGVQTVFIVTVKYCVSFSLLEYTVCGYPKQYEVWYLKWNAVTHLNHTHICKTVKQCSLLFLAKYIFPKICFRETYNGFIVIISKWVNLND